MDPETPAAIILAGGRGRRMRREKPLLPVNGRPLMGSVIDQIRPCFRTILIAPAPGKSSPTWG